MRGCFKYRFPPPDGFIFSFLFTEMPPIQPDSAHRLLRGEVSTPEMKRILLCAQGAIQTYRQSPRAQMTKTPVCLPRGCYIPRILLDPGSLHTQMFPYTVPCTVVSYEVMPDVLPAQISHDAPVPEIGLESYRTEISLA